MFLEFRARNQKDVGNIYLSTYNVVFIFITKNENVSAGLLYHYICFTN